MKDSIKRAIYNLSPNKIKSFYQFPLKKTFIEKNQYTSVSYSQDGEDLILKRIFHAKEKGFYVDVGAHHPKRFSNTYIFYLQGWNGINIDPMPLSMKEFNLIRPRDINLEIGISDKNEDLNYYIFNEPALNTFSPDEAQKKNGLREYKIIEQKKIPVCRLDEVLDKYIKLPQQIDFLSIDAEGLDLKVLKSNNWRKYSPNIVLVESNSILLENIFKNEIYTYMKNLKYEIIAKTFKTIIFKLINFNV